MIIDEDGGCVVNGGIFGDGTYLNGLFSRKVNVVLGMNGSGKSTIARYFAKLKEEEKDDSIFVFNEDFIDNNVRFVKDGMGTIAMFGEQIDEYEKRQKLINELDEQNKLLENIQFEIDCLHTDCELNMLNIVSVLDKHISSFSYRLSMSRGYKTNQCKSISAEPGYNKYDIIDEMLSLTDEEINSISESDAERLLEEVMKAYSDEVDWKDLIDFNELNDIVKMAMELMSTAIHKPQLTEEDNHLLTVMTSATMSHYLEETKHVIEEGVDFCPVCHRPFAPYDVDRLKQTVEKLLTKEAADYSDRIVECINRINAFRNGWEEKERFFEELESANGVGFNNDAGLVEIKVERLGDLLYSMSNQLKEKKRNLYIQSDFYEDVIAIVSDVENRVQSLKQAVANHNKLRNEAEGKRESFNSANLIMAYHECSTYVEEYRRDDEKERLLVKEKKNIETKIALLKKEIQLVIEQSYDFSIAAKEINDYLCAVFCEQRISLDFDGRLYKVKIYDKDIIPSQLSTGERNVLAMSYFLVSIKKGKTNDIFKSIPITIVIDDPITSFDSNNIMGMWRMMIIIIDKYTRNDKCHVLILTHDFASANYFGERYGTIRTDRGKKKVKIRFLDNNQLFDKELYDTDYWNLMYDVYHFGFEGGPDIDTAIMNKMRRLLETYCSFNYKSQPDFKDVVDSPEIQNESDRLYFKTCNNRFFLNSGSHNIITEFSLNQKEKQKLARAVIFYLYLLDKRHVKAYLDNRFASLEKIINSGNSVVSYAIE